MRRGKVAVILLLLSALIGGCAVKRKILDINRKPLVLAVMPFENFSNDAAGAEVCRKKTFETLLAQGFLVLDLEKTDSILRGLGVTDGGQLKAVEIAKLAEGLGTAAFVTGEVQEYFQGPSLEAAPFGLCFKRQVKLQITVKDVVTGKVLFTGRKELVEREALDKQEERKKKKEEKRKEREKAKLEGRKVEEKDAGEEEREPTFFENLFGGLLRNVVADTIYSGVESMADIITKELVDRMPFFYEESR